MIREYPSRPIVGVGAVIMLGDKVVLVKRGSPPGYGTWSLPGGVVELGETLREAVVREVREETGLRVKPETLLDVIDRIVLDEAGNPRYHYVLVDFLCMPLSGELAPSSDSIAVRLVTREEVAASEELPPEMRQVIEKAFLIASAEDHRDR